MFRLPVTKSIGSLSKAFGTRKFSQLPKACVVGAAGGIGQPLSLLMKNSPSIGDLNLFDIVGTPGVATDLSHICTTGTVKGFIGPEQMAESLKGCQAVVIPAGVPRKPGMTRDDLFNTNAGIVMNIAQECAKNCPDAFIFIISNPVNSTVPIFAEAFKKTNPEKFNPGKIIGVTTLDITRANTFCAEILGVAPETLNVPVIGGHAGTTILPLLSQIPGQKFNEQQLKDLTHRIQFGGDEVVQAKDGAGSATLSMAYAANVFVEQVMDVVAGKQSSVTACAYVQNEIYHNKHQCEYFATPTKFGPNGVEEIYEQELSSFEQAVFDEMIPALRSQVQKGKEFVLSK